MASSFSPATTRPESSAPSGPTSPPILVIEGLEQRLRDKERPEEFVVQVRERLTIREGDFVALLGPSGCGKTTLLTVLGLLRSPTDPKSLKKFSMWTSDGEQRTEVDLKQAWLAGQVGRIESMRRQHIGFALQSGELLPALTVRENIAAPLQLNGISGAKCWERVDGLIGAFGLRRSKPAAEAAAGSRIYDLSHARVNKLSGGESQRVSLARAVAHNPRLVFVDEPTAALNRELAYGALEQFRRLQTEQLGRTATIMITHDEVLAQEFANVTIRMSPLKDRPGGEVVEISYAPAALS